MTEIFGKKILFPLCQLDKILKDLEMHPSNKVTLESLDNIFTYHDDPKKIPKYVAIREAAKNLAKVVLESCPDCADRAAAIRKVREVCMTANAAIALDADNQ